MQASKILIVEDDRALNDQLAEMLCAKGYEVDQSYDGESGLTHAIKNAHQLILLDVMLPQRDGFSLLNILRKTCETPVIMITAKGAEEERIKGFSHGADDYLAKPFSTTELMFRVDAVLRRYFNKKPEEITELTLDGLYLDKAKNIIVVDETEVDVTPIQFKLLSALLENVGEVLSKAYLYQTVLNKTFGEHDRSLDMHLSRLRRKLVEAGWPGERLQTVHGKGYCLA